MALRQTEREEACVVSDSQSTVRRPSIRNCPEVAQRGAARKRAPRLFKALHRTPRVRPPTRLLPKGSGPSLPYLLPTGSTQLRRSACPSPGGQTTDSVYERWWRAREAGAARRETRTTKSHSDRRECCEPTLPAAHPRCVSAAPSSRPALRLVRSPGPPVVRRRLNVAHVFLRLPGGVHENRRRRRGSLAQHRTIALAGRLCVSLRIYEARLFPRTSPAKRFDDLEASLK